MNVGITPVAAAMTTCFCGGVATNMIWNWNIPFSQEIAATVGGAFITIGIILIQLKSRD